LMEGWDFIMHYIKIWLEDEKCPAHVRFFGLALGLLFEEMCSMSYIMTFQCRIFV